MPFLFNDSLDDTPGLDGQSSFVGGQVSNVRPNLLSPNQGTLLQDVDAELNGVLRTRRGFRCFGNLKALTGTDTVQALQWFDSVTGEYLIAIAGGKIYRCDSGGTWTLIESGAVNSTTLPADVAQVNDHLFASTRDSRPRYWTQTNLAGTGTAQIETATAAGTITLAGNASVEVKGTGIAGSPLTIPVAVLLADTPTVWAGKVRVALAATAAITAVYNVGGSGTDITLTRITPAANDGTLNVSLDNGTCTGITASPTSTNTQPGALYGVTITDGPAKLALLTAQKFRLFGINPDAIDQLYTSIFLPDGLTPFTSGTAIASIRIGEGEGDPITALFAWKGFTLLVAKEGSIWSVDTTPGAVDSTSATLASGFTIARLSGRIGCVAHRSFAMAGNDAIFLARDGVRSLAKTIGDEAGAVGDALSFPIDDYIQRINWAAAANACAAYWQGRYLLAVPLDTSTVNNAVLVYRPQTQAWTVWTGLQPVQFTVSRFNGAPQKLAMLDARGNVLVWRDYIAPDQIGTTDFRDEVASGTDSRIAWRVRTRALTFQEPLNPKQVEFLELEFVKSTALVDVDIILDGDYSTRLAAKMDTGTAGIVLPVYLPFTLGVLKVVRRRKSMSHYGSAREVIVELREPESSQMTTLEAAGSGYLSLRSLQAAAFVDTMEDDE